MVQLMPLEGSSIYQMDRVLFYILYLDVLFLVLFILLLEYNNIRVFIYILN